MILDGLARDVEARGDLFVGVTVEAAEAENGLGGGWQLVDLLVQQGECFFVGDRFFGVVVFFGKLLCSFFDEALARADGIELIVDLVFHATEQIRTEIIYVAELGALHPEADKHVLHKLLCGGLVPEIIIGECIKFSPEEIVNLFQFCFRHTF